MKSIKKIAAFAILIALSALILESCATGNSYRKCNGKKAIKTKMGPM
jgi:hypothetical protein